jgi:hypothetical protein
MTQRVAASTLRISSSDSRVRNPGIASSLSSVPPVCPRPRPDIIGTSAPHAAASGASTSDSLSPTPPVECLSTGVPPNSERSNRRPDRTIASVSTEASSSVMPRSTIAMSIAAT